MKSLNVGWIDYLNTVPFDFTLTDIGLPFSVNLVHGVPQKINKLLRENKIDIGFISSAEYIENFENYYLFPDLSISALNKVHSVVILSNIPLEEIKELYLTQASKSSQYLTKIIFSEFLKKNINYKKLENYEDLTTKSVLLIGDNAMKFQNRFEYVYDLSSIWYEKTRLPFVFALWSVRKEFYEENENIVNEFAKALKKSKMKFFENPEFFLKKKFVDQPVEDKLLYLKNLDYCLSDEHMKSLKLFANYLKKINLIEEIPQFRFIKK